MLKSAILKSHSSQNKNPSLLGINSPFYNSTLDRWEATNVLTEMIKRRSKEYNSINKLEESNIQKQAINHYRNLDLKKDGVKAFVLSGSIMTPFISGKKTLSEAGITMDKPDTIEFTINAQFLEGGYFGNGNNQGISYANGKSLGGSSQKEWYYISQDAKGGYSFGKGDPTSASYNAVGGARPLIINGLPYGEFNKYTKEAPKNLLQKGDPGEKYRKYITQRSAAYFPQQNIVNVGKTLIGYNNNTQKMIIIVQQNETDGYSLDAFRNYLLINGYTNALSLDGSNSALLIMDNKVLIKNIRFKDETTDSGLTFSVPK